MDNQQIRLALTAEQALLRTTSLPGRGTTVSGYAAVYGAITQMRDGAGRPFHEVVDRGAFDQFLANDVVLTMDHDTRIPLARTPDTLRIFSDNVGLGFEATLPDSPNGMNAGAAVRDRVIRGASFGAVPTGKNWQRKDGVLTRHLTALSIFDVALTARPQYTQTSVDLRNVVIETPLLSIREKIMNANKKFFLMNG